ncbi:alpha/beta fold hydrolase [Actinokineospora sp. NBRC 105648]|uniref:alpha/beta fold hydrolase n=1 Tax=Actinokineospora sp. NBRC 105648 TaxID=3032206 RepID=UPI0024A4165D|nr:alpha/beta fold hydrolase [Actinokineospora sp. NBRC 105648]GLZ43292.1 alpha/beta hydrolase [Actinokineospora sp. NBRC 105648]
MLFIHGHPFDRTMWTPQLDHFGGTAVSLRGYRSGLPATGTTPFSTFAHDVAGLVPPGKPVVLCGLSMGGQIAMEFHRLYPDRVRALILADTTALPETPESRTARLDTADRLRREGIEPYAREVLDRMVLPRNAEASEFVLEMMLRAPAMGAAAAQRGRADRPDYRESLMANPVPTLVIVGDQDSYTPVEEAAQIPATKLVVIEDAAHLPNLEQPASFNQALADFLSEQEIPHPLRPIP